MSADLLYDSLMDVLFGQNRIVVGLHDVMQGGPTPVHLPRHPRLNCIAA
jgi:hypothetical protein